MRAAALLLAKDVRLLLRSPALLLVLVAYPLLVALLVALALQGEERRPAVALVSLDDSGRTVAVGDRRLSVDDYVARLEEEVDLRRLGPREAEEALSDGRVSAVLTIPEGFIADLQTGIRQPVLGLAASRRSPVQGDAIVRRMESAVYRLNQALAEGYVEQVLRLVDLVVTGGELGAFGRGVSAIGLVRSRELVTGVQEDLRGEGLPAFADRLDPIVGFIDATRRNLDLATPAANAISAPIRLEVRGAAEGREPLSAFGLAGALLVSLGLVGVLLGAAAVASEREDNVLSRLGRGLVSPAALVGGKAAFTAAACALVGLVLLGAVALSTSLAVGRWGAWVLVLALAGLAFGAFGVLAGALAGDTRTGLLAGLMVALPLMALSLLPDAPAAAAIAQAVPFGPAFDAFRSLLVEPRLAAGELAGTLAHLAGLAAVLGAAGAYAVRRRARA